MINADRQQFRESVAEVSTEDFNQTMKTNPYALHRITQAAVPHLPPGLAMIKTASIQAYEPSPIVLAYATTKAGIVAYHALAEPWVGTFRCQPLLEQIPQLMREPHQRVVRVSRTASAALFMIASIS
ncbi:MAG TPA: SDR family oxidoreductase [Devosia sp.]|nr:SDR family oxidoreductase [Devosia sp.]